ncbi:hypothetical protein POTOM_021740 [Populus tomentosa]|uniref:Uncharacterized protein n=1 Tax=Populus tomentosa TaxID=118781 RepID=A0A8X7ZUC7_POPTO|nr:hypothetical protein POTOM_021740 [Populus tomentosa]
MRITTFDHIGFPKSVAFEMNAASFFKFFVHTPLSDDRMLECFYSGVEQKMKQSAVMSTRIAFSVLGFLMLGTLIYTLLSDGSPFRKELLTPWMVATLIDFYINVVALSVGLGWLQGIEFDQWILMDIVIDMLWEKMRKLNVNYYGLAIELLSIRILISPSKYPC